MDMHDLEHFRSILNEREDNLEEWLTTVSSANADELAKVRSLMTDIRHALVRIEDETYGVCQVCKGDIELHRLEVQPIAEVCLDCISDEERATLQEELQIAAKIHRALLPQEIERIDGFDIGVRAIAARTIGGDYFDFIRRENDATVRVVIADTMGKGIPAGLVMSNLQGALRILSQEIDSVSRLVAKLNHWLCRNVPVTKFVSLTCIDLPAGARPETTIRFTNAGHCPGIIMRHNGRWECLDSTGPVIGVHEDFIFEEHEQRLHPGDLLVLYTDGLIEAANPGGDMYEQERLISNLSAHRTEAAETIVGALLDDVRHFSGSSALEDDFTAIVIKKL